MTSFLFVVVVVVVCLGLGQTRRTTTFSLSAAMSESWVYSNVVCYPAARSKSFLPAFPSIWFVLLIATLTLAGYWQDLRTRWNAHPPALALGAVNLRYSRAAMPSEDLPPPHCSPRVLLYFCGLRQSVVSGGLVRSSGWLVWLAGESRHMERSAGRAGLAASSCTAHKSFEQTEGGA